MSYRVQSQQVGKIQTNKPLTPQETNALMQKSIGYKVVDTVKKCGERRRDVYKC
jgi:hypothetical protein